MIREAVQEPYRLAFKNAASTIFSVSLASSGTVTVLACFTANNDKSAEDYVAGGLHNQRQEKQFYQHAKRGEKSTSSKEASGTSEHGVSIDRSRLVQARVLPDHP